MFQYKLTVVSLHKKKLSSGTQKRTVLLRYIRQFKHNARYADVHRKITCTRRKSRLQLVVSAGNKAKQIHGLGTDSGKFILKRISFFTFDHPDQKLHFCCGRPTGGETGKGWVGRGVRDIRHMLRLSPDMLLETELHLVILHGEILRRLQHSTDCRKNICLFIVLMPAKRFILIDRCHSKSAGEWSCTVCTLHA